MNLSESLKETELTVKVATYLMLKTRFINSRPGHVRERSHFALAEPVALNGVAVTKPGIPNGYLENVEGDDIEMEAPEEQDDAD